jgi:hypothetical protein
VSRQPDDPPTPNELRIANLEAFARWAERVATVPQADPWLSLRRIREEASAALRNETEST